jgi:hypothetical protein
MKIVALVILVIMASLFLALSITLLVRGIIINSEAFKTAIEEIERNPQVIDAVGRIEKYGFLPMGNLSIRNGYGYAAWKIKVIGYSESVYVQIKLKKENQNQWEVIELLLNR